MSKFEAGQMVDYSFENKPVRVISGPHASSAGKTRYLVERADGVVSLATADLLTLADGRRMAAARVLLESMSGVYSAWDVAPDSSKRRYMDIAAKALAAADGTARGPLAVGDKIRILRGGLEGADVEPGDVLTIEEVTKSTITTDAPGSTRANHWYFLRRFEGTGWERI